MTAATIGRARSSRVLQGSAWILVGLGVQALLGFAFWLLGSRVASSTELGQASALFTAIQFVNYASGLGLTIALARHGARPSAEADSLFGWALVATVASSAVGGAAYLSVVHTAATDLVSSTAGGVLFCLYTAGTSIGLLVDVRLMAARRWGWLVGRLALAGLVRLPLVGVAVSMDPGLWLYHLMLAPLALTAVAAALVLGRMGAGGASLRRPASLAGFARFAGVNWVAALSSQAPQFVLPLVVAQRVPPSDNASFFLGWTVTGLVFLVPAAIAQVLLVEGGREADGEEVLAAGAEHRAREALGFSLGLAVLAWVASLVVGPLIAALFGPAYDRLATLLPVLMAAGIPWAVTSIRLSEARIRRDQIGTIAITVALGAGILLPTWAAVPTGGTDAAARAWVFGNLAGALVAEAVHRRHRRALHRTLRRC